VSTNDEQHAELYEIAAEEGWQIERGIEDTARPWRRPWIARRAGRNLYGDERDLMKRMAEQERRWHNSDGVPCDPP
jgi:hypothetical protein